MAADVSPHRSVTPTAARLAEGGGEVSLETYLHVREDALQLYGFLTRKEKDLFLALIGVSGVGPKLALNIVSGLPFDQLVDAITRGDDKKVSTIPGIGPKTAARLVLELKDKVAAFEVPSPGPCKPGSAPNRHRDEAVSALVNLGYKKPLAEEAVKRTCTAGGEEMPLESLIRDALKMLAKGQR